MYILSLARAYRVHVYFAAEDEFANGIIGEIIIHDIIAWKKRKIHVEIMNNCNFFVHITEKQWDFPEEMRPFPDFHKKIPVLGLIFQPKCGILYENIWLAVHVVFQCLLFDLDGV